MKIIASFFVPVKGGSTRRQGFAKIFFLFPSPPQKSKRAYCRLGATAPSRQYALDSSGVGACYQSERLLRNPVSEYV